MTIASPNVLEDPDARGFVKRFTARFGMTPDDSSITAYDAALVIIDAIKRVRRAARKLPAMRCATPSRQRT